MNLGLEITEVFINESLAECQKEIVQEAKKRGARVQYKEVWKRSGVIGQPASFDPLYLLAQPQRNLQQSQYTLKKNSCRLLL